MSMPSDTTPDVADAIHEEARVLRPVRESLSSEQRGLIAAALVAFFGIAYIGPAIARLRRGPSRRDRAARALRDAKERAEDAARQGGRRMRRLGGGTIRR
jgi:hypothetical protein